MQAVYRRLYQRYGPQHWWPGESRFEVIIGAILTQSAAWGNVERALQNLKAAGVFSAPALRRIGQEELAHLIRPTVYFNVKARKVKAFVNHLVRYDDDLDAFFGQETEELRRELLSIYGIGEETADDILLYAAYKPVFVIDAYTRRILGRLELRPHRSTYSGYQELFHRNLPPDTQLYNEYHALLDRHGVEVCRTRPLCAQCCLLELCPTGQAEITNAGFADPKGKTRRKAVTK